MVSFARVRTRSLLSKLWPAITKSISTQKAELAGANERSENILEQNKSFFAATKNGGMWFS